MTHATPGRRLIVDRLALPGLERPAVTVEGPRGRIARFAPDARRGNLRASPAGANVQWYRPHDLIPSAVRWTAAAVVATVAALLLRRRIRR
ncbi:MAG: hypothetical protein KY460_14600 [Actinobacteria bacterium]|nr:hypothetical protein [Actinomycetota bacterium]